MLVSYCILEWLGRAHPATWIGYVKAFSEAAMVGALADWFAVTALFHHPLGIPIPHTNLIEKSKQSIGNNLGAFVVTNFLNPGTIRPYISQLKVSGFLANWLLKPANQQVLIRELMNMAMDVLQKMDDQQISQFVAAKAGALIPGIKLNVLASNAGRFLLDQGEHQKVITVLAQKAREYIRDHEGLVREKVKGESYFFIPGFVEDKLAAKITLGLMRYFEEIEVDPAHRFRGEVTTQLLSFMQDLSTSEKWVKEFQDLGSKILSPEKLQEYVTAAWLSVKGNLMDELKAPETSLGRYMIGMIQEQALVLQTNKDMQEKLDSWIRHTAFKLILSHADKVGTLISETVGNWEGNSLSQKLELEVGKDLQFIRINGTLVGGLVGLVIYTLTQFF